MTTLDFIKEDYTKKRGERYTYKGERKELIDATYAINKFRHIDDRVKYLEDKGYTVSEKRMGSGGVGTIRQMNDGTTRVQIGYGHGRYNYAQCLIFKTK